MVTYINARVPCFTAVHAGLQQMAGYPSCKPASLCCCSAGCLLCCGRTQLGSSSSHDVRCCCLQASTLRRSSTSQGRLGGSRTSWAWLRGTWQWHTQSRCVSQQGLHATAILIYLCCCLSYGQVEGNALPIAKHVRRQATFSQQHDN